MTPSALPRRRPGDAGVDAAGIDTFLDAAAGADLELHSLMLLRHGHVVAEGWAAPYEADGLQLLYSLSKSFTATAIGLAQAEGLLLVEDRLLPLLADVAPPEPSERLRAVSIRDALAMATGHREDTLARINPADPVRSVLALPVEEPPGTWFAYNNGATLLLSAAVTAVTGQRVLDYLAPRLLEPLGIERACWAGMGELDQGFSGLHLATEAVAKLGLLYLQGGQWQGQALLPADWVAAATARQIDNPREPEVDWRQGYGYQFWQSGPGHGYRGDGAYGQFCLMLPDVDAVVVTTAATDRMQALLDLVWEHLLPALGAGGAGAEAGADARLAERLTGWSLPPVPGSRNRPPAGGSETATTAAASSPAPAGGPALLRVLGVVEAPDGWSLRLADAADVIEVRCGYGAWLSTAVELPGGALLELAASAAWTGPTTLTAEVTFVRSPHRLRLTIDETTGTAIRWHTEPLWFRGLADLALPRDRTWTRTPAEVAR